MLKIRIVHCFINIHLYMIDIDRHIYIVGIYMKHNAIFFYLQQKR